MAFTNGELVSMHVAFPGGGLLGPLAQLQPPLLGDVAAFAGVDVLWQSGFFQAGITAGALDLIGAPDAGEVTRLQGRFVTTANSSPEYAGVVVMLYTRDQGAGGAPTATIALIRTNFGTYREILAANVIVITGR